MCLLTNNHLLKLLVVTLSICFSAPVLACPCFNHDNLVRQFQGDDDATCHLMHFTNSGLISMRLRDEDRIASASATSCQLTLPFRNLSNQYFSYKQSHLNCITEVVRACKRLNLPIEGANAIIRAKMHSI